MSIHTLAYLTRQVDRKDKEIRRLQHIVNDLHNENWDLIGYCQCKDCKAATKTLSKKLNKK